MDTQTLDLLKIRDDVTWYIRKLGLSKLFKLECSEYSQLTKEFLSTVALAFPNHNGDQPAGDGLLLFKIGDANGRISSQLYANSLDFPMRQHMTSRRTQRGNKLPLLIGHTLPMNHSCLQEANKVTTDEFYILTTPFIKHEYKANLGLLLAKTFINVRKLAKDLEGNKKLCVRFGRLITAIHIHFLNRWTKDPTRFCYEFPIGPANTSLVLLPHETSQAYAQELSLSSPMRKISMFHQVRNHHSPCSPIAHFSMQSRLNAASKNAMFSLLAWPRIKL
ncbi:unnamed protein product [Microthlaspi erraticum]|uniref:Arabidopsis retrotransposon Orf1 C-terminal domain-containing protein n=1 Tax=Microthlaspi erraticum TaxID=1685480 RepID=A0A6D2JUB7_9BRAS|nr:unnamed protein product [Microthlaspi erraticum]